MTFGIGLLLADGGRPGGHRHLRPLRRRRGSTTLPDGATVPVLGYALAPATSVAAPGGPVLVVTEGDVVTVNSRTASRTSPTTWSARSPRSTSRGRRWCRTPPASLRRHQDLHLHRVEPRYLPLRGGSAPRARRTRRPVGLHGALVVRPLASPPSRPTRTRRTAFDDEAVLVLSELDPVLNRSASPAAFDMRNFKPPYFLINGKRLPGDQPHHHRARQPRAAPVRERRASSSTR